MSSNYAILWTDSEGRTRALAHRDIGDGPALSDAERVATDSMLNTIALNSGIPRSELPLKVPDRKSPLEAIGFDLDGRLWIERAVADQAPGEADLYARDGTWIATYQWPSNVTMRFWAVRGEVGLGVEEGVDGAQRVVRLRFK